VDAKHWCGHVPHNLAHSNCSKTCFISRFMQVNGLKAFEVSPALLAREQLELVRASILVRKAYVIAAEVASTHGGLIN
jgi:hypothetical protein